MMREGKVEGIPRHDANTFVCVRRKRLCVLGGGGIPRQNNNSFVYVGGLGGLVLLRQDNDQCL
jgi:hypothetical protein